MLKRDDLFPYLIVSIFLHIAIYFLFHGRENPVFLSSLVEVSFYSPYSQKAERPPAVASSKETEAVGVSAWEQIKSNDTKEYDGQSAKPVVEKRVEVAGSSGNSSSVETFQEPDTNKPSIGADSQCGELSFDTKNFKYSYYSGQIIRKIRGQWRLGENYGKLRVLVYFKIYRNGTISDIFVKESSKNDEYDKYALDTVRRASPFPDLPDGYEGDSLGVFFEFKNGN
jgi:TonB family protein